MSELIVGGVIILFVVAMVQWIERSKTKRRQELAVMQYSDGERREIAEDFLIYAKLPADIRDDLDGLMHVFIDEKGFEACGGLEEITPHMQRVIAAQACLLIVRRPHDMYRNLRSILVYPDAFGFDERGVRLGESWSSGTVILSWSAVVAGGRNDKDGNDVSIHEFAHQLDQANEASEGAPLLENRSAYREWSSVFAQTFARFTQRAEKGKKTVFDTYGATNPAEFFAVATETFFEKPQQLYKKYPDLYEVLKNYYNLDPLHW